MTPSCQLGAPAYPVFDIAEIAQEASERAGADFRSGYDLRTCRRAMELIFIEWANRGLNLWTIDGPTVIDLTPGGCQYTLPADTVDLIEHVIRTWPSAGGTGQPSDLPLTRFTVSEYAAIPNKLAQGRPSLISIRRAIQPYFLLWQVPPTSGSSYQMVYWRLKRIAAMPPGGDAQPGIPWRFVNALTAGMAFYIALKSTDPKVMPKINLLKTEYEEQFQLASDEDRDRASFNFVPLDYSFIR
jgi:hypothetical protein